MITKEQNKFSKRQLAESIESRGGKIFLSRLLNDFYNRLEKDIIVGFFFVNKDLKLISRRQTEFILKSCGLSKEFKGKHPKIAHQNLAKILKGHFDRRLRILEKTLRDHSFKPEEIENWVRFENAFRSLISEE